MKQYVKVAKEDISSSNFAVGCGSFTTNDLKSNAIHVGLGLRDIKSEMQLGNVYFYTTKKFNMLEKKMWKLFFGVTIRKYTEKRS